MVGSTLLVNMCQSLVTLSAIHNTACYLTDAVLDILSITFVTVFVVSLTLCGLWFSKCTF